MANSKSNNKMQREKLLHLIEIVSEISKQDGNEWFIDELLKSIGDTASLDYLSKNAVIRNIHEYCIEKVIEDQAREFYKDFPVVKIKEQLIQDFIKMEHERRRGDFVGFGIAMYQQIENIVNYTVARYFNDKWIILKNTVVSPYLWDPQAKRHLKLSDNDRHKGINLEKLIFEDRDQNRKNENNISKYTAREMLNAYLFILSYKDYNKEINLINFNTFRNELLKIYYTRNKVHRNKYKNKSKEEYEINNESIQYILYYAIFHDFYSDALTFFTDV